MKTRAGGLPLPVDFSLPCLIWAELCDGTAKFWSPRRTGLLFCLECMCFSFVLLSVAMDAEKGVTLLFSEILVVGAQGN